MRRDHVFPVDPDGPGGETIEKAATLIKHGGLVIFPTSSFYGLGVNAFDADAVDKVFQVKKRDTRKPLLILVASISDARSLVLFFPETAEALAKAFWPGSLTLVLKAKERLPSNLTGHTGKIGIRLAGHTVALNLVKAAGGPVTGTSANISGKGGCTHVADLDPMVARQADMILDAGHLPGWTGSSVVDVTVCPPRILREGAVSAAKVQNVLRRRT